MQEGGGTPNVGTLPIDEEVRGKIFDAIAEIKSSDRCTVNFSRDCLNSKKYQDRRFWAQMPVPTSLRSAATDLLRADQD